MIRVRRRYYTPAIDDSVIMYDCVSIIQNDSVSFVWRNDVVVCYYYDGGNSAVFVVWRNMSFSDDGRITMMTHRVWNYSPSMHHWSYQYYHSQYYGYYQSFHFLESSRHPCRVLVDWSWISSKSPFLIYIYICIYDVMLVTSVLAVLF